MRTLLIFTAVLTCSSGFSATRYQRLAKYWENAFRVELRHYNDRSMWVGNCVYANRPEKFHSSSLQVHHHGDDILGTQVIMKHKIYDEEVASSNLRNIDWAKEEYENSQDNLSHYSGPKEGDRGVTFTQYSNSEQDRVVESYELRVMKNERNKIFLILRGQPNNRYDSRFLCYYAKDVMGRYHFK